MNPTLRKTLPAVLLVAAAAAGGYAWFALRAGSDTPGLTSGNGRIEATEIDVATKLPGRVADVQARIIDEVRKLGTADDLKTIWAANGADFGGMTQQQFAAFVSSEVKRWATVVKTSGAKLD